MINKTVNLDVDKIQFLYPNYSIQSYVSFLDKDKDVIYVGKLFNGLIPYLEKNTKSFINTVGTPDLDLSSDKALAEYIFSLRGVAFEEHILDFLDALDEVTRWYFLKVFYLSGKFVYPVSKSKSSMYQLFKSVTSPMGDCLKTFVQVLKEYPFPVIESSFLTFINKVEHQDIKNISPMYSKLIKQTYSKCGSRIKSATLKYAKSSHTEVDFLNYILTLRG